MSVYRLSPWFVIQSTELIVSGTRMLKFVDNCMIRIVWYECYGMSSSAAATGCKPSGLVPSSLLVVGHLFLGLSSTNYAFENHR